MKIYTIRTAIRSTVTLIAKSSIDGVKSHIRDTLSLIEDQHLEMDRSYLTGIIDELRDDMIPDGSARSGHFFMFSHNRNCEIRRIELEP